MINTNYNIYTNGQLHAELILRFGVGVFSLFVSEKANDIEDSMYDCFRTWAIDKLTM